MNKLFNQLIPFLLAGIGIVALAFGIMLLAYLLFFGALIGTFLYLFSLLKKRFFSPKKSFPSKNTSGRIIDSDDWKPL